MTGVETRREENYGSEALKKKRNVSGRRQRQRSHTHRDKDKQDKDEDRENL